MAKCPASTKKTCSLKGYKMATRKGQCVPVKCSRTRKKARRRRR